MIPRRLILLFLVLLATTVLALPNPDGGLSRPKRTRGAATKAATGTRLQQAAAAAQKRSAAKGKKATKVQARAPQASKRMGQRKRSKVQAPAAGKKDYSSFLCPGGSVACPVNDADPTVLKTQLNSVADWFRVGFECVDLQTELEQCGGCRALGKGWVILTIARTRGASARRQAQRTCRIVNHADLIRQDCSTIENVKTASCEQGRCVVLSCAPGYNVSGDRDACIAGGSAQQPLRRRR